MRSFALLGFAGLYFAIALALAWVLGVTLFYPNGFLASHIVVAASCFGAFANPLGFLARGLTPKPDPALAIEPHFPVPAIVTFSATTIGFLALVVIIVVAAWKARPKSAPVALGGE
jgi:hypothetical protein